MVSDKAYWYRSLKSEYLSDPPFSGVLPRSAVLISDPLVDPVHLLDVLEWLKLKLYTLTCLESGLLYFRLVIARMVELYPLLFYLPDEAN